MDNLNNNSLIQKFLDQKLSADEKELFRQKFNADPLFRNEVQKYSAMIITLKASDRTLKNSLNISTNNNRIFYRRFLLLAASIVLIVGIGILFLIPNLNNKTRVATLDKNSSYLKSDPYHSNPTIENALTQHFRRTTSALSFSSPTEIIAVKKGTEISFMISSQSKVNFNIVIYNNNLLPLITTKEVYEKNVNLKINLLPGLYYWKYESNQQSGWGGKIIVLP